MLICDTLGLSYPHTIFTTVRICKPEQIPVYLKDIDTIVELELIFANE